VLVLLLLRAASPLLTQLVLLLLRHCCSRPLAWRLLLQLLLLLGLLLLGLLLLRLALRLWAAASQQFLHVVGSIHPVRPHHDSGMKQLPPKHSQRPRQTLISRPFVS
jgi:membrane-associated phospholipid phosphatase